MALVESFSGIRGMYGVELTKEIIVKYANAYYLLLKKKTENPKVVIGMDSRPSGEEVFNYLIEGLGCEVINVGVLPTPIIENAVREFNCDGGIIITASHNEPEYNGFKFLDKDGAILRPSDVDFIIEDSKNNRNIIVNKNKIICKRQEAIDSYKNLIRKIVGYDKIKSNIKILVDPNGGSGIISKEIFDEFGINSDYINMEEGNFKRLVEPNEASLKYLQEKIIQNNCEFAVGFDCDADRVEILLNNGELVSGNQILALIADEIFSESTHESIVVNDATSYLVKEIAEKYNSSFIEVEVGEINVVDEMIKLNSPIGGEGSNGGVIIPPSRCRDGILTVLILLKSIAKKNMSLNEIITELPKYYYLKEKFKINENFTFIKDRIKKYYSDNGFEILQTGDETGGLKAIKNNSWIWFRQSKTEDKVLRIIADSKDENISLRLMEEAKTILK